MSCRHIVLLGATGSIGQSACRVARELPERVRIVGMSGFRNIERLAVEANLLRPAALAVPDAAAEAELRTKLDYQPAAVFTGPAGLDQLARIGFRTLGLQTYLTAGPKEARAWTIKQGWSAPQAAGVIHTDFQRGFIKAEIVSFDDLVATGSMAEAKAKGKVRMEGKEYIMQDGDVVEFRFNV